MWACVECRYMLSSNSRLQQLRQNSQSPVTWFRNPYVQLILVRVLKDSLQCNAYYPNWRDNIQEVPHQQTTAVWGSIHDCPPAKVPLQSVSNLRLSFCGTWLTCCISRYQKKVAHLCAQAWLQGSRLLCMRFSYGFDWFPCRSLDSE